MKGHFKITLTVPLNLIDSFLWDGDWGWEQTKIVEPWENVSNLSKTENYLFLFKRFYFHSFQIPGFYAYVLYRFIEFTSLHFILLQNL